MQNVKTIAHKAKLEVKGARFLFILAVAAGLLLSTGFELAGSRNLSDPLGQVPGKPPAPLIAADLLNNYDLTTAGNATFTGGISDNAGCVVKCAGDVNGDGFADFLVSAYAYPGGTYTGRVYLVYGNGSGAMLRGDYTLASAANASFTGEAPANQAGYSVAGAGDVNGDGYADFLIGAINYDSGAGRAYLYYGNGSLNPLRGNYPLGTGTANVTFSGAAASDNAGYSVAGAGDVNGDGYADILVSAQAYSSGAGRVYLFYGKGAGNMLHGEYNLTSTANATFTGEAAGHYAGTSVAGAGDVNGDGYADFLVGARGFSSNTGRAYLIYGNGSGAAIYGDYNLGSAANATFTGEATSDYAGRPVAGAGDVNGDGYADILVGASGYSSNTGRAYLIYGNGTGNALRGNYYLASAANATFTGETSGILTGGSIAGAGDVNGDGYADLLISAEWYNSYAGRAYLFYGNGSSNMLRGYYDLSTGTANATFTGVANSYAGRSVASAGDVNGDGYADILIGAYGYTNRGRAYLIYGNSSYPARITDLVATSISPTAINLMWTAPGADGWGGKATAYYLKVSDNPINASNWASAAFIQPPVPAEGGSRQSYTVTGRAPSTTCYFAMVTDDGSGHVSRVSNSPHATTPDANAPSITPPLDVTYAEGDTAVHTISWTITDSSTNNPTYTIRVNSGTSSSPSAWAPGVPVVYDVTGWAPGVYNVEISVSDGYGGTTTDVVVVTVSGPGIGWDLLPVFLLGSMSLAVIFMWRKARRG